MFTLPYSNSETSRLHAKCAHCSRLSRLAQQSGTHNQRNCYIVSHLLGFLFMSETLLSVTIPNIFHSLFSFPFLLQDALFSLSRFCNIVKRQSLWWETCDKALFSVSGSYTRNCENDKHNWKGGRDGVLLYCCDRVLSLIHSTTRNRETLESYRSRI